jgi:CelD/BcsL family acetyltransferase involved in cellulose biosynthesis
MSALRVRAYRSLAEAAPLRAELDALNRASRRPSPFDTFTYLETFVAHDEFERPGQRILLLVAFDGASPVGYLPLRRVPERLLGVPFQAIRFLTTHDSDRPRAVAHPDDEARCCEAFYRHLFEVERGFSFLELQEQDAESKLLRPPGAIDRGRYRVRLFPNNPNAAISTAYPSLGAYLRALSHGLRKKLRRQVRALFDAGEIELVSSGDPSALPALFDLYLDLERRSWKAQVDGHIGRHPERMAFFRRLLEPDQPMKVAIRLLLLGGLPVAGIITGAFAGRLYGLEEAFDDGYRDLSPGNTMMLLTVREAIVGGYPSLNLLGNYAYYKSRWLATITETQAVQLFRTGSLIHLKALAGDAWRRLRPPFTQREADFNLAKKGGGEEPPGAPPPRREERERAQATLRALAAAGAKLDRLGGEALRRALPFETSRDAAGRYGHAGEVRS